MIEEKEFAISILGLKDLKKDGTNRYIKAISDVNKNTFKIDENLQKLIIHFDVMDNKFVSNTGVNLEDIKIAKENNMYADVHLMVENPIEDGYIDDAIFYGADSVTVHYEIKKIEQVLKYLNEKKKELKKEKNIDFKIGVSIKPDTDIKILKNYATLFDKILIMTVEPGYGLQKYILSMNEKIIQAKKIFPNKIIQIDGGINEETINHGILNGASSFVLGGYFTKSIGEEIYIDIYEKYIFLNILNKIYSCKKRVNIEFAKTTLQIVENGYGFSDTYIGIPIGELREIEKNIGKYINYKVLDMLFASNVHDYRMFACIVLSNKVKSLKKIYLKNKISKQEYLKNLEKIHKYYISKHDYINNWDLTDETAPKISGEYLLILYEIGEHKKLFDELDYYSKSSNYWVNRIGIVSMLTLVKNNFLEIPLNKCDEYIYSNNHLLLKATGWVLREIYKKDNTRILKYLTHKNKEQKIPSIVFSYATEKMTKEEKSMIR